MSIGINIPAVQGVQDQQVARILQALKSVVETHTGHNPKLGRIRTLGPDADLDGVINKVNEIINMLQD